MEGYSTDEVNAALTIMDAKRELAEKLGKEFSEQDRVNRITLTNDLKNGRPVLSALVSNGDYPVNIDLLMVCKKRLAYQRVINRLCETGLIENATLDSLAIAEINKILGKHGFETACYGCFVESRRLRIQEWANTICSEWNSIVDKFAGKGKAQNFNFAKDTFVKDLDDGYIQKLSTELENADLHYGKETVVKKMEKLLREVPALRKHLSVADLITPQGRTKLRSLSAELNSLVACRYGSNTPKMVQDINPYNAELAKYNKYPQKYKSLREYLYAIGGARMQSFSDFIIENWFDYCQIVADLSARKLPMHTYTKEISLVKLLGMTGIKVNMSLIPDLDMTLESKIGFEEAKAHAGLTLNENGEWELIFADKDRNKATGGKSYMQSINFADALALQNDPRYSANVGTIAVGVSEAQIRMMLNDPRIRMVIPYHASGMNPIFADMVGTKYYNDFTDYQNTTVKYLVDENGKKVNPKLTKAQRDNLTKGFEFNETLQELGDARATAQAYLDWCADASQHSITIKGKTYNAVLTPKFEMFAKETNYYKVLEDFNCYDCITEDAAPQGYVTQTYPEDFEDILRSELKAQQKYRSKTDPGFDSAMAEISEYLEKHTAADTLDYAKEHGIKLSKKDIQKGNQLKKEQKLSDRDSEYLSAVESGDMETAQKMVDEAAKNAGYTIKAFHSTNADFTVFDKGRIGNGIDQFGAGFYFGNTKEITTGYGQKTYPVYLKIQNPIRIRRTNDGGDLYDVRITKTQAYKILKQHPLMYDKENSPLGDFYEQYWQVGPKEWMVRDLASKYTNIGDLDGDPILYRDYPNELHEAIRDVIGYDGVEVYHDYNDFYADRIDYFYVAWFDNQMKSSEPVVRDDSGNVIPLSERFDEYKNDIRYSDRKSYSQQVDEVKNSTHDRNNHVYMGTTPTGIANVLELPKLPMLVTSSHVYSMAVSKAQAKAERRYNRNLHYHELGWTAVKNLPEYMNKPVLIIKSNTDPNDATFVIITAEADLEGRPIMAVVKPNGTGNYFDIEFPSNVMLSGYGRNGVQNYVARAKTENRILYANKKNSQKLKNTKGVQFSNNILASDYTANLAQFKQIVKRHLKGTIFENSGLPKFSERVTDKKTLDFLNKQIEDGEYITVYRSFQVIDGGLYAPMNAVDRDEDGKNKRLGYRSEYGQWEMATESPAIAQRYIDAHPDAPYAKFDLDGVDNKTGGVAYNPYLHSSNLVLNDQFSAAYRRNLITVECRVPLSEVGAYKAKYAKDTTGWVDWKPGGVAGKLMKVKPELTRKLFVSRYMLPVRQVSDAEVARMYKEYLDGTDISVPWNVVTPGLRHELEKIGVPISYKDVNRSNGPLKFAEAFPDEASKVMYSDRDQDGGYSNRTLLANALETTAQHEVEKKKLAEYKEKVDIIDAEERKLGELNAQIRELSFAKGPRDSKKIQSLRDEAIMTANRINTYDRQLLNLESTQALKNVLQREKEKARKRAEQKGKEALDAYKERAAKTQRELITKYQDSRKKAVENRNRTAMRHKVQNVVKDLNNYLLNGDKKHHVPVSLQKAVAEALNAVNMDTVGAEERIAKLQAQLAKAKSPDVIADLARKIENVQAMGDKMSDKLDKLSKAYEAFLDSDDPDIANAYDEVIANLIKRVSKEVGDTPLRDMTTSQLESVYELYKGVLTRVRDANKAFAEDLRAGINDLVMATNEELSQLPKRSGLTTSLGKSISTFSWNNEKPVYAFERIGSKTLSKLYGNIRNGEDTWVTDVTDAKTFFGNMKQKYGLDNWDMDKGYDFTSASGKKFTLTLQEIMSLYAYAKREADIGTEHLRRGGFIFDDNAKSKTKKLFGIVKMKVIPEDATFHKLSDELIGEIIGTLDSKQKDSNSVRTEEPHTQGCKACTDAFV